MSSIVNLLTDCVAAADRIVTGFFVAVVGIPESSRAGLRIGVERQGIARQCRGGAHRAGDTIQQGDTLLVMEAMKMEHTIHAPADGVVDEVFFAVGDQVAEGAALIALREAGEGG